VQAIIQITKGEVMEELYRKLDEAKKNVRALRTQIPQEHYRAIAEDGEMSVEQTRSLMLLSEALEKVIEAENNIKSAIMNKAPV
jgi:hypothetical protein